MSWQEIIAERERQAIAARFSSLSPERRAEIDEYAHPHVPEAARLENDALWDHVFEQEARGLSAEEADVLWHQMFTDAFDDADLGPRPESAPERLPETPLEHEYLNWRCHFLTERLLEETAATAANDREQAHTVIAQQEESIAALRERIATTNALEDIPLRRVLIAFEKAWLSRTQTPVMPRISDEDLHLFRILIAGKRRGESLVRIPYREIGPILDPPVTAMTVSRRVRRLFAEYPRLEALRDALLDPPRPTQSRSVARPVHFSAMSAAERSRRGIE